MAVFGLLGNFKKLGGAKRGFGGVPRAPAAVGNPAQAVGARVQPQAVPAVHGLGEVVHGRPGHSTQRLRHPVPARRRRSALCKRSIEENGWKAAPVLK